MRYLIALIAVLLAVFGFAQRASAVTSPGFYGYYVSGSTYSSTTADWTMPSFTCGAKATTYVSIWTGLDGLTSDTTEQIGAEVDCAGGTADYYGWYDLYPGPVQTFASKLSPGDKLEASVTWDAGEKFTLTLEDVTAGWDKTVTASQTSTPARSSAETFVEVPNTLACAPAETLASFTGDTVNGKTLGSLDPTEQNSGDPNITVSAVSAETFKVTCK
ncbi:MAG TPA: G1 family glutamic endopeptidase [Streptosporangiaceae bacterium]|jgi:hypothetical protein